MCEMWTKIDGRQLCRDVRCSMFDIYNENQFYHHDRPLNQVKNIANGSIIFRETFHDQFVSPFFHPCFSVVAGC